VLLQVKLAETQRLLTAANAELQQLRQQMQTLTTQEKTALGNKTRVAHRVAQLQVWVVCLVQERCVRRPVVTRIRYRSVTACQLCESASQH